MQGRAPAEAAGNNEIGPTQLFVVGHLTGTMGGEALWRHVRSRENAHRLDQRRRPYDCHRVAAPVAPGLEQQRDVEHGNADAARGGAAQKADLFLAHQRMQDAFE